MGLLHSISLKSEPSRFACPRKKQPRFQTSTKPPSPLIGVGFVVRFCHRAFAWTKMYGSCLPVAIRDQSPGRITNELSVRLWAVT